MLIFTFVRTNVRGVDDKDRLIGTNLEIFPVEQIRLNGEIFWTSGSEALDFWDRQNPEKMKMTSLSL